MEMAHILVVTSPHDYHPSGKCVKWTNTKWELAVYVRYAPICAPSTPKLLIVERHAEVTDQKRDLSDGCEVDSSESFDELIATSGQTPHAPRVRDA
jgi:hypothetical protein